jgi:hypothetical protein
VRRALLLDSSSGGSRDDRLSGRGEGGNPRHARWGAKVVRVMAVAWWDDVSLLPQASRSRAEAAAALYEAPDPTWVAAPLVEWRTG